MINVNVTLRGETVVLKTDHEVSEARRALIAAASFTSPYVWLFDEQELPVLFGFELKKDDFAKLVGSPDAHTEREIQELRLDEFVLYKDAVLPLKDFSTDWGFSGAGLPAWMEGWDAFLSDSFFSGLVLRYGADDNGKPDRTGDSGVTIATFIVG